MKIRNIVFDIGNVLVSYQPLSFHIQKGDTTEMTELFLREIYYSPEWQRLDQGTITLNEAILSIGERSVLTRQEIARVFMMREELLFPLKENTNLLKSLKKRGYTLFYLSNFPEDMFGVLTAKHGFFKWFDGGVVSSAEKLLKPSPEIFRILVSRYNINPSETLFIDDLLPNIEGAASEGFITLHLPDHTQLRKALGKKLNNHNG